MKQEIFDKDGNKLELADLIYDFMKDVADKSNTDIEDVVIGVYTNHKNTTNFIESYELVDNGYDGYNIESIGELGKVER